MYQRYNPLEKSLFYSRPAQASAYFSSLESAVVSYAKAEESRTIERVSYVQRQALYQFLPLSKTYTQEQNTTYTVIEHGAFLNPQRPPAQFVNTTEDVQAHIDTIFRLTTGEDLPKNITIRTLSREELKAEHERLGSRWSEGIQGFALNTAFPQIFVKENPLDLLLLTLGHEIGHVITKSLSDPVAEEAKAFAFEMAWLHTIIEHNIAGLAQSFTLTPAPANNGLHDKAFAFVMSWLKTGKKALDLYWELFYGAVTLIESPSGA